MVEKKAQKIIKRKKKWVTLIAPAEFNNLPLGETPVYEPETVVGRTVIVNLMTLTREPKKQSYNLTFKVKELKNHEALTESIRYELSGVHIKRLAKKGKEKLDHAFLIETKDNVKAMIKPMLVTRGMVQHSKLTFLRKKSEEFMKSLAKDKTFAELMIMLINSELQKMLKADLKKAYPLSVCEIRMFERV